MGVPNLARPFVLASILMSSLGNDSPRVFRSHARRLKVLLGCGLFLLSGCKRSAQENAPHQVEPVTNANRQVQPTQPQLPDCDTSPNKAESSMKTGHHRVVLTWNASSSSNGPGDQSVGYCIYRSRNIDITAKDLDHCNSCTRLNRRPVIGTGCVDDHVEDGATYYYVTSSIRGGSKVGRFSNQTTAAIPANSPPKSSDNPYPLCRPDDSALRVGQGD